MNVVMARNEWAGDGFVSVESSDVAAFALHSDETLWKNADALAQLAARRHTKAELEQEEKISGLCWHADGILWELSLRPFVKPISCSMNDWCHVFLVSGIAQIEMWLFLEHAADVANLQFSDVHDYLQAYHWPAACHNPPRCCFNVARAKPCAEAGKFKCGASEFLNLFPVLQRMVEQLGLRDVMGLEVESLFVVCRILDVLMGSARLLPSRLQRLVIKSYQVPQSSVRL